MRKDLVERRLAIWWAVLVLITLLSWGKSRGEGAAAFASVLLIIALAFAKVAVVVWEFMEVRHAPIALRLVLGGWMIAAFSGIVGLLYGGAALSH